MLRRWWLKWPGQIRFRPFQIRQVTPEDVHRQKMALHIWLPACCSVHMPATHLSGLEAAAAVAAAATLASENTTVSLKLGAVKHCTDTSVFYCVEWAKMAVMCGYHQMAPCCMCCAVIGPSMAASGLRACTLFMFRGNNWRCGTLHELF